MRDLDKILGDNDVEVKVPDLDWLSLDVGDVNNIPTPNNVEILPQLQDAWSHGPDKAPELIPCVEIAVKKAKSQVSEEDIQGVVDTVKKEMMSGVTGKELTSKLSSLYTQSLIHEAKDHLVKLAEEQGLLGNVYVDMSVFNTCKEARRVLGNSKIRTAKYAIGQPKQSCCSTHKTGFCNELHKRVVDSVSYDDSLFSEYTTHLKVAGAISSDEEIKSKEDLRDSFLKVPQKKQAEEKSKNTTPGIDPKKFKKDLTDYLDSVNHESKMEKQARVFHKARPVLAFIQNEMLKGHMGERLKEAISKKFPINVIEENAEALTKVAALQGLMGNVYVDVSYYKDPEEAIQAIKKASTSPNYIVQSVKSHEYDDTVNKIAKATGCQLLPLDGKIDSSIGKSYIDDLLFSDRISSEQAITLKKQIESGENVLGTLKKAFISTLNHKKAVRMTGIKAHYHQSTGPQYKNRDKYREAAHKAIESGIAIEKIEDKLASMIPTPEATRIVRDVLSTVKEVHASTLTKCASEKYPLSRDAVIKKASKCSACVYSNSTMCAHCGVRFANTQDPLNASIEIDPKTEKVLLPDNPDEIRSDMLQEYDMTDSFGSGMNVKMDEMHKESSVDVDVSYGSEGIDNQLVGF